MHRVETGAAPTVPSCDTSAGEHDALSLLSRVTSSLAYAEAVLDASLRGVGASVGSAMVVDRRLDRLHVVAARGPHRNEVVGNRMALGDPIAGKVAVSREPLWVPNVDEHPDLFRIPRANNPSGRYPGRAFISVPWIWEDHVLGVLNVSSAAGQEFCEADFQNLTATAPGIARCLHLLRTGEDRCNGEAWSADAFRPILTAGTSGADSVLPPILDLVDQAVVLFDRGGRITWANEAATTFFSPAGRQVPDSLWGLPIRVPAANWRTLVETGLANGRFPPLHDIGVETAHGHDTRVLNCHGTVLRDGAGAIAGGCFVFEDCTRTVRLTRQARAAEKRSVMGDLLSEIMHELSSPLDSTRRLLKLAQRRSDEPAAAAEHLADAMTAMDRMVGIVTELLAFSRSEASTGVPRPLTQVLDTYFHDLAATGRFPDVRVVRDYRGLGPVIPQTDFTAIIDNLVRNACDAMDGRGTIVLFGEARDGQYVLEVQDTGPGVPPELQDRIFEPFFTTKPYGRGTGLGLALCRKILEPHGGTLSCTAQPGIGSTFRIVLPIDPPDLPLDDAEA